MSLLMRIALVSSLWLIQIECSPHEKLTKGVDEDDIAETGKIPWQVRLHVAKDGANGYSGCGGSLISKGWVLTAAHCVVDAGLPVAGSDVTLIAGSRIPDDHIDGQTTTAQKIIVHPEFDSKLRINDIALIQLDTPFRINEKVHVIRLGKKRVKVGTTVYASGWGDTEIGYNPILNYVDLKTISNDECAESYEGIFEGTICTRGDEGKNVCDGDGGGPLVTDNKKKAVLVGIVSVGDCTSGSAAVFTRVAHYRKWIKENAGI